MLEKLPFLNTRRGLIIAFWVLLVPILLPLFALMYSAFFVYAAYPLITLALGSSDPHNLWIPRVMAIVSIVLAVGTTIGVWKSYKQNFVDTAPSKQLP